jgi:phenylpropionate dioxygenase-like ring-hydroxylating dioxygenase large terminal subunit
MRQAPKDGKTRFENTHTQPLKLHKVFNNSDVLPEGWYPVCSSQQITIGQATSFKVASQRLLVYRTASGKVVAMDAFCPHMGADLGNGKVIGENIQCYFHQWEFGLDGNLVKTKCKDHPTGVVNQVWPVEEKYGFIWVYSACEAAYPVPIPKGLEGQEIEVWNITNVTLYAHHHVMMLGGVDIQHFATVHNLDIDFDVEIEMGRQQALWKLEGMLPEKGWRSKLLSFFLGKTLGYDALIAGGSVITLTYGPKARWKWTRSPATMYMVWGCVPQDNGISRVNVFLVTKRAKGVRGMLAAKLRLLLSSILLMILKDDDVKAFPFMRYNTGRLTKEDNSVIQMVRFINNQPISIWSKNFGDGSGN